MHGPVPVHARFRRSVRFLFSSAASPPSSSFSFSSLFCSFLLTHLRRPHFPCLPWPFFSASIPCFPSCISFRPGLADFLFRIFRRSADSAPDIGPRGKTQFLLRLLHSFPGIRFRRISVSRRFPHKSGRQDCVPSSLWFIMPLGNGPIAVLSTSQLILRRCMPCLQSLR